METRETEFTLSLREKKRKVTMDFYIMYTREGRNVVAHAQLLVRLRPKGSKAIRWPEGFTGKQGLKAFADAWNDLPVEERGTLLRMHMRLSSKAYYFPHHLFGIAFPKAGTFCPAYTVRDMSTLREKGRAMYPIGETRTLSPASLCDLSVEAARSFPVNSALGFNCRDFILELWARIIERDQALGGSSLITRDELQRHIEESRRRDTRVFITITVVSVLVVSVVMVLLTWGLIAWFRRSEVARASVTLWVEKVRDRNAGRVRWMRGVGLLPACK